MKHFLFLLPCEIECSTKEWFPSNGNFSLVGTQHAVHCDWVLLREYGESSCLDVLNLKVKLYFWPFRAKVNITISQWSLKLRKTNRPKYGTTRKRESKLKSCSFFGCFSQWLWLVDLENYGGYIYIYIYIAQVVITSSVNQNISIGLMIYFVWSKNAREQEFRLSCYTRYNHIQISSFLCTLYPVRG